MAAVEFVKDRRFREPFADSDYFAGRIVDESRKKGLLLRSVGLPSIVAIAPCLAVTQAQMDEMLRIVDGVLGEVERDHGF